MGAVETELRKVITPHLYEEGGLIRALRTVQDRFGCIPIETDGVAAALFNLSHAEVKGVVSFYSDFSRKPKGRTVLRICVAEACQSVKGRELTRAIEPQVRSAGRQSFGISG